MSKELVEKGEMEVEQSEALVAHAAEADTCCKLLTKAPTSAGCSESWTSRGPFERLGPSPLATRESLVGLLESKLIPIFWKSESESDPSATWCTAAQVQVIKRETKAENCSNA